MAAVKSPVARKYVTRKEAAEAYATSVWKIDELIAAGLVSAKKDGRRIHVNVASLDSYFDGLEDA